MIMNKDYYDEEDFIVDELTGHQLYTKARMNPPEDNLDYDLEILVYGETDEDSIKEPHFHVCKNKIDKEGQHYETDIEVKIRNIDKMIICNSISGNLSWEGLHDTLNMIKAWLGKKAYDADMTNKEAIRQEWNRCNMSHRVKVTEL